MTAANIDDASAPIDIKDSNNQQNGKAEPIPATYLINITVLTVEGTNITSSYPKHLTLDIGGRKFKVSRDTLMAESGLFERQLSGRFRPWEPEVDGSYFLDADPDLFEHLLRFMRRPEVFPLFYSKMNGFDYDLYNRLQAEALYFQIDALHEWIKDKKYLTAIKVQTSNPNVRSVQDISLI
ncbi:uncharacterized protein ALTATR162_LOCUS6256 [Alternaria atra]|uniref:BTB domain-containing protein n=1 Tax=Alternaria atra TaxID=119953 RepID=A0A8J2N2D4_9PLEO|nr:uncharacterized protein ALTATR162_LOCUS6256 [Alternaria atra]CAG5162631.1 unnamed protein product [Alternaria atra]